MTLPPLRLAKPPGPDDLAILDDPEERQRYTRWTVERDGTRVGESTLRLSGMYCAACAGTIEAALHSVDGVRLAQVSAAGERARIRWDPQHTGIAAMVTAIRAAGYDAVPDGAAEAADQRRQEQRQSLWRLFVAWFCMMQVMMLATPSYVAGPGELADDLRQLLNWGSWMLSLPVVWWSAAPFLQGAWRSLKARRIGMDVPVSLGVLVTFVASTGATFNPGGAFGAEVYFDSLTMFVAFLLGGRYLEMRARHRAASSLESALAAMPQTALRLRDDGGLERVSVLRLRVGDDVQVPVGDAFPADGLLRDGPTQADEALLTGESAPVVKQPGDTVVAGSLNAGSPVRMQVTAVGADTRYERIVSLMQQAFTERPALARSADRWATPFLWVVLLLAAGAAAAWSVIDPSRAVWVAVSVLIVTCPCALSLAAPSALVAAAGGLVRRGVLLQRLDALESMARVSQLFVDKTGTLTQDPLRLAGVRRRPDQRLPDEAALCSDAAALAGWSSHPLSRGLAAAFAATPGERWQRVQELPGRGLLACDADGTEWRLGHRAFVDGTWPEGGDGDRLEIVFGRSGQALLAFDFEERLRDDARPALDALAGRGIAVSLLSGDAPTRVARVADLLGLPGQGGATPEDKLSAVRAAQAGGRTVAMVGDGINDAPVMAQADVSFAMGHGALVARVHADAIVLNSRLTAVADTQALAVRTLRVIRQNITWAATYNAACIPLALAGYLPPWAAGLGMATSSLLVVANSMRLAR